MHLSTIAILLGILIGSALGGINCEGSKRCSGLWSSDYTNYHSHVHHAQSLYEIIMSIPTMVFIPDDELIACTRGICAYLKDTGGLYSKEVVDMALELVDHGCTRCGEIPVGYPDNNKSDRAGTLVFNIEKDPCASHGLCPNFQQVVEQYYKSNSPMEMRREAGLDPMWTHNFPPAEGQKKPVQRN